MLVDDVTTDAPDRAPRSAATERHRRFRSRRAAASAALAAAGVVAASAVGAVPAAAAATAATPASVASVASAAAGVFAGSAGHWSQDRAVTAPTRYVRVNGLPVAYRAFGSGPVLLLTPCLGLSMDDWDPALLDDLAKHHTVVIYDSDGIGRTPASAAPALTVSALADQAYGLIQALGLHAPAVAGYSLGGFIAQRLAVDHPHLLSALVLIGTSPGGPDEVLPDLTVNAPLLDPAVGAAALPALYFSGHPEDLAAWHRRTAARPQRVGVDLPGLNRDRAALLGWLTDPAANTAQALPTITTPTLVLAAGADQQEPAANSAWIAHAIPGARLITYPHLSHAFPFEAPHRVAGDITCFLQTAR